jgi:hypothetical protein
MGEAWCGRARRGWARPGKARQGKARQGPTTKQEPMTNQQSNTMSTPMIISALFLLDLVGLIVWFWLG